MIAGVAPDAAVKARSGVDIPPAEIHPRPPGRERQPRRRAHPASRTLDAAERAGEHDHIRTSRTRRPRARPSVPTVKAGTRSPSRPGRGAERLRRLHTITTLRAPVQPPAPASPIRSPTGRCSTPASSARRTADRGHHPLATPTDLTPGTYTFFCRVHPFMRGAFRVEPRPTHTKH